MMVLQDRAFLQSFSLVTPLMRSTLRRQPEAETPADCTAVLELEVQFRLNPEQVSVLKSISRWFSCPYQVRPIAS